MCYIYTISQEIEKNKQPVDDEDNNNLNHTMKRVKNGNDQDKMDKSFATWHWLYLHIFWRMKAHTQLKPFKDCWKLLGHLRMQNKRQWRVQNLWVIISNLVALAGLLITKRLESSLLHAIVALSCFYPDHGLLSYETHHGTSCKLLGQRTKIVLSPTLDNIWAGCIMCPHLFLQKVLIRLLEQVGFNSIWHWTLKMNWFMLGKKMR
jgi:hypothetical protein